MMMNKKRSSKIELSKYAFLLPILLLTGAAFTVSRAEGSIEGVVEKANETTLLKVAADAQQGGDPLSVKRVGEAGTVLKEAYGTDTIKIDTSRRSKGTTVLSGQIGSLEIKGASESTGNPLFVVDGEVISKKQLDAIA